MTKQVCFSHTHILRAHFNCSQKPDVENCLDNNQIKLTVFQLFADLSPQRHNRQENRFGTGFKMPATS